MRFLYAAALVAISMCAFGQDGAATAPIAWPTRFETCDGQKADYQQQIDAASAALSNCLSATSQADPSGSFSDPGPCCNERYGMVASGPCWWPTPCAALEERTDCLVLAQRKADDDCRNKVRQYLTQQAAQALQAGKSSSVGLNEWQSQSHSASVPEDDQADVVLRMITSKYSEAGPAERQQLDQACVSIGGRPCGALIAGFSAGGAGATMAVTAPTSTASDIRAAAQQVYQLMDPAERSTIDAQMREYFGANFVDASVAQGSESGTTQDVVAGARQLWESASPEERAQIEAASRQLYGAGWQQVLDSGEVDTFQLSGRPGTSAPASTTASTRPDHESARPPLPDQSHRSAADVKAPWPGVEIAKHEDAGRRAAPEEAPLDRRTADHVQSHDAEPPAPGRCGATVSVERSVLSTSATAVRARYVTKATTDTPNCALVHFQITFRRQQLNGSVFEEPLIWSIAVRGGNGTDVDEIDETSPMPLIGWDLEVMSCARCTPTDTEACRACGE